MYKMIDIFIKLFNGDIRCYSHHSEKSYIEINCVNIKLSDIVRKHIFIPSEC